MPIAETGLNPWMDQAHGEMWSWIDSFGLAAAPSVRRHIDRTAPELMAARYFPTAGRDLLPLLAEYVAWGFMVDDEFDEGPIGRDPARCRQATAQLVAALDGTAPSSSPLESALADLVRRTCPNRSAAWQRQFFGDLTDWLGTYIAEAMDRAARRVPSPEVFWEHRQLTIGMRMFMDLAEIVAAVDLPDEVRLCPHLLAMRRAAAEQISIVNDLFSVEKDVAHGFVHNHVIVRWKAAGGTIDSAVRAVTEQATECLDRFFRADRSLWREDVVVSLEGYMREGLHRCTAGLRALIRGNYDWHFEVTRYSDADELSSEPGYVPDLFTTRAT